jgi:ATP adenylyltransferase
MDRLFAPWRIEWVERDDDAADIEGCVFCELPARGADRASRIVAGNPHAYVMLNNYPYNPGHVMVIPRPHVGEYPALDDDVLGGHATLKARTFEALEAAFEPDGFNTGLNHGTASGGSIDDHLHTHVVPRWEGDTNFMPVIGETKVIVEALDETHDRLRDAFAGLEGATEPDPDAAIRLP